MYKVQGWRAATISEILDEDFFANTLSQMSQSFSDLFFNVLTGRFDDLKDLAKQAFEAILRAFLDLVSAIATRQIVLSIAGAFDNSVNVGKTVGQFGGLNVGENVAMFGSAAGSLFGGGAAGGATGIGASLGLSGISSVGSVPTGGAEEMEYRLAA